jgi:hypothetical protein
MNKVELLDKLEELSIEYQMALDWGKIQHLSVDGLKNVLGMVERIYKLR